MLNKLVDGSTLGEPDKQAAREVIKKLDNINAFGSAARSIQSDTDELAHTHVWETQWDGLNAGKLIDKCRDCGKAKGPAYDPRYTGGYRGARY